MSVSVEQIKQLRDATGLSMTICKKSLVEADGDLEKALENLRKQGAAKAAKFADRSTGQGLVASYIHSNKRLGVLVQLSCETDFVARGDDFQVLANDIAMHVAAADPLYLSPSDVAEELVEKERGIWKEQLANEGKPEQIWDKIMEGKEKKFREDNALLTQKFVKNPELTIEGLVKEAIAKLGENIKVARFSRFSL